MQVYIISISMHACVCRQSCWVLPLHGSLTAADQSRVFKVPNAGITKIVLSTNVAETSITIPDVTVVIDSCRVKQTKFDAETEVSITSESQ